VCVYVCVFLSLGVNVSLSLSVWCVSLSKPAYEDMHIQALKRHIGVAYARLEAAGTDFTPVEKGAGMQKRLVEFLNEHG